MYSYEELKQLVETISSEGESKHKVEIEKMAGQLGFTLASCNCQSKWRKAFLKVKEWVNTHNELCHYEMSRGIIYNNGEQNIFRTNLTDELAEWCLEHIEGADKHIRRVISDEPEQVSNEPEQVEDKPTDTENVVLFQEETQPTIAKENKKKKLK